VIERSLLANDKSTHWVRKLACLPFSGMDYVVHQTAVAFL